MNPTIFFSVCSLFYCVLLIVITFSKKSKKDSENNMLKILITTNLIGLLLEVAGLFLGNNYKSYELLNDIVLRLMLVYYLLWMSLFIVYILVISGIDSKKIKKYVLVLGIAFLAALIYDFSVPLYYNVNDGVIVYSSGPAVDFIYNYSLGCSIVCLFIMFKNFKKSIAVKYAPLFVFISLGALVSIVQSSNPQILLSTSMQTFVTYLVYFTTNKEQSNSIEYRKESK